MTALALVLAVVLVALTVGGILGRVDGSLGEPTTTTSYVPLPDDRLTPADLESLRLDTALRGYRMAQVDEVVGRLTDEISTLNRMLRERHTTGPGHEGANHSPGEPLPGAHLVGAVDPPPPSAAGPDGQT